MKLYWRVKVAGVWSWRPAALVKYDKGAPCLHCARPDEYAVVRTCSDAYARDFGPLRNPWRM